jgi:hypothetical protein
MVRTLVMDTGSPPDDSPPTLESNPRPVSAREDATSYGRDAQGGLVEGHHFRAASSRPRDGVGASRGTTAIVSASPTAAGEEGRPTDHQPRAADHDAVEHAEPPHRVGVARAMSQIAPTPPMARPP